MGLFMFIVAGLGFGLVILVLGFALCAAAKRGDESMAAALKRMNKEEL
jgi:hypothetical protein